MVGGSFFQRERHMRRFPPRTLLATLYIDLRLGGEGPQARVSNKIVMSSIFPERKTASESIAKNAYRETEAHRGKTRREKRI